MSSREEYIRKLQAKLEVWNAEIDKLGAKAGEVKADIKNEYHEQIESLRAKQATAGVKIDELQQAGEHAWKDMKAGIEHAWNSLEEAIASVKSRFK